MDWKLTKYINKGVWLYMYVIKLQIQNEVWKLNLSNFWAKFYKTHAAYTCLVIWEAIEMHLINFIGLKCLRTNTDSEANGDKKNLNVNTVYNNMFCEIDDSDIFQKLCKPFDTPFYMIVDTPFYMKLNQNPFFVFVFLFFHHA